MQCTCEIIKPWQHRIDSGKCHARQQAKTPHMALQYGTTQDHDYRRGHGARSVRSYKFCHISRMKEF